MNRLISFLKKARLGQILTVFLAGLVLLVSTACNSGNVEGARPNNLPVQMGGANNPHKSGGDGYTNYKMSTDPKVNSAKASSQNDRAEIFLPNQLIANKGVDSSASDLLYPGAEASDTNQPNIGSVGEKGRKALQTPQVPSPRQPVIDRSDPNVKILEKTSEAFKDASQFLKDTRNSALD